MKTIWLVSAMALAAVSSGCAQQAIERNEAAEFSAPLSTASVYDPNALPSLGAGDALGSHLFTQAGLASGAVDVDNTDEASVAE